MPTAQSRLVVRNVANQTFEPAKGDPRRAGLDQLKDIECFYDEHSDARNCPRSQEVLKNAMDEGNIVAVEHLEPTAATKRIVAASAVFDHFDGRFWEVGATRSPAGGLGLQCLMYAVAAAQLKVFGALTSDSTVYCTVLPENGGSIHNIRKFGFVPWDAPSASLVEEKRRAAVAAGRNPDVQYYRLPESAVAHAAVNLLEYDSMSTLQRRPRTCPIMPGLHAFELCMDVLVLKGQHRNDVLELASTTAVEVESYVRGFVSNVSSGQPIEVGGIDEATAKKVANRLQLLAADTSVDEIEIDVAAHHVRVMDGTTSIVELNVRYAHGAPVISGVRLPDLSMQ